MLEPLAIDEKHDLPRGHYRPASRDAVIVELTKAISASGRGAGSVDRLFEQHIRRAMAFCAAGTGDGVFLRKGNKGGLALWQLQRATEILETQLDERICVKAIAGECGLTTGYFRRAFRASTGVAPSQWLVDRRIERAKMLLSTTPKKLAEIALDCGFTDHSHFTRVFGQHVGVSPGRWRGSLSVPPIDHATKVPQRPHRSLHHVRELQ